MGYTHYFSHQKVSQKVWDRILVDCKELYRCMPEHSESSGGHYSDQPLELGNASGEGGLPEFDKKCIHFNGIGAMHFEDFLLQRDGSDGFGFCKTARKPYDLMVQACLLVYKHHSPETIELDSDSFLRDGSYEDWRVAMDFVKEVLGYFVHPRTDTTEETGPTGQTNQE